MQPLFSVLIANYNNGRYLQESIDSVLAQTYTNWEIVLVDDGSSDNSFEIYEKYKDDGRFHFYYNEENKGCGFTKRRCAELAHGELCGFLDPDDKLTPEALEVMAKEHEARPECSLIYSTHYSWDDVADTLVVQDLVGPMQNGEDFLVSSRNCVSHFAVFKKQAYSKTVGINPSLRSVVDVDEYFVLEEVGELFYIDKPLYYYRVTNPNSISLGAQKDDRLLRKFRMTSSLNAFVRRIKAGNPLVDKNRDPYVWAQIEPLIAGLPLVAHNKRFDEGCLKAVFRVYQMDYPDYVFFDTMYAARRVFPHLPNHQLQTVAAACGYELLNHHHALADAEACAWIAREIL